MCIPIQRFTVGCLGKVECDSGSYAYTGVYSIPHCVGFAYTKTYTISGMGVYTTHVAHCGIHLTYTIRGGISRQWGLSLSWPLSRLYIDVLGHTTGQWRLDRWKPQVTQLWSQWQSTPNVMRIYSWNTIKVSWTMKSRRCSIFVVRSSST